MQQSVVFISSLFNSGSKISVKGVGPTACMQDEKCMKKLSWKMCTEENTGRIILKWTIKKKGVLVE
jgi:hypothetical protein